MEKTTYKDLTNIYLSSLFDLTIE